MADITFEDELLAAVRGLNTEQQRRILDYVRQLGRPATVSGQEFLRLTAHMTTSAEDLREMEQAITEMREQSRHFPEVDFDE